MGLGIYQPRMPTGGKDGTINQALLSLRREPWWEKLEFRYLGR